MSVGYRPIQWTPFKRWYDVVVILTIIASLSSFTALGSLRFAAPHRISIEALAIRAFGLTAFLLLNLVLCIGPLARLSPRRFLPLLHNRRHLGVATFLTSLVHALLVTGYYHGFGVLNPVRSLLISNTRIDSISAFPFEWLGIAALVILFLLAATSHDFWLRNLGAPLWKSLHMLIYPAYALLILHVALGSLQSDTSPALPILLALSVALLSSLHLAAAWRERRRDHAPVASAHWIDAGPAHAVPPGRATSVTPAAGPRIAIFNHNGCLRAVAGVCAHQGGPLAEGRIIDGCITCPWHGWQYRPEDGQSPPPFTERIPTYEVRIENQRIYVDSRPLPPGSPTRGPLLSNAKNTPT